ncbi:hypothetical protein HanIR_Chr02g0083381 [Helianthus annuus]|nr:hypothetical protein HanIR_Chr02g0083381 [Helianthus annuus]
MENYNFKPEKKLYFFRTNEHVSGSRLARIKITLSQPIKTKHYHSLKKTKIMA